MATIKCKWCCVWWEHWCNLSWTATNRNLVTFLFSTATKTDYTSKCSDFKKLIDTITISNLYLKKENNENDMAYTVVRKFAILVSFGILIVFMASDLQGNARVW